VNPYEELLAFAELEADLIRAGAWEQLTELDAPRMLLLSTLPQSPPPSARPYLERAHDRLKQNAASLAGALAQTRGELDRLGRTRTALGSYATASRPALELKG
jgi:hypothetical protein